MPTGYTSKVESGEITELKDYVLKCARNFGAFAHMRDKRLEKEPEMREVDSYYLNKLNEAKHKLENFKAKSREEFDKDMQEWLIRENESRARYRESCALKRKRYLGYTKFMVIK